MRKSSSKITIYWLKPHQTNICIQDFLQIYICISPLDDLHIRQKKPTTTPSTEDTPKYAVTNPTSRYSNPRDTHICKDSARYDHPTWSEDPNFVLEGDYYTTPVPPQEYASSSLI